MTTNLFHEFRKRTQGKTLVVCGNFNSREIKQLKAEGYRYRVPQVNKHGIPVVERRVS